MMQHEKRPRASKWKRTPPLNKSTQPNRRRTPMNCSKNLNASVTLPLLALLMLTGCAAPPTAGQLHTMQCPKLGPLPAAISRIGLQPSTASLQKASEWSLTSRQLLDSEILKSKP